MKTSKNIYRAIFAVSAVSLLVVAAITVKSQWEDSGFEDDASSFEDTRGQQEELRMIKRELPGFRSKLQEYNKKVQTCKKFNVTVPDEATEQLATLSEYYKNLQNVTGDESQEDLNTWRQAFHDSFEDIDEAVSICDRVTQLQGFRKQVSQGIKRIKSQMKRISKNAQKVGLESELDEARAEISALEEFEMVLKGSDVEAALARLEEEGEEFGSRIEEINAQLREVQETVGTVRRASQILREVQKELVDADKIISSYTRKCDTTDMKNIVAEGKDAAAELAAAIAARPVEVDLFDEIFEGLKDIGDRFDEAEASCKR